VLYSKLNTSILAKLKLKGVLINKKEGSMLLKSAN
jgi:hypothetical protein